jgi:type IV pilus assembly protein PilP
MKTSARIRALAVLLGLGLALAGCQESQSGATTADLDKQRAELAQKGGAAGGKAVAKGGKAAKGAPVAAVGAERTNYGAQLAGYSYDPTGKRDPFRSFVLDRLTQEELDADSPLEQFELGQLVVSGVVWQADRRRALVLDPSGQAYVVKVGDKMGKNDGEVTVIDDSALVVLESYVDFHGDKTTKEIEMRIRQSTGG